MLRRQKSRNVRFGEEHSKIRSEPIMSNPRAKAVAKTAYWLHRHLSGRTFDSKQIIAIIVPILADNTFMILMGMLNTAMISSAGVAAISAVSMVDSLNMFMINVFVAIATGGTVIVAQYKGAGNEAMLPRAAAQTLTAVAFSAVIISAAVIAFRAETLNLLFGGAEPDVYDNAVIYLVGSCLSYPLLAVYQAVAGVLRGVAETKAALVLSMIMNVSFFLLNIVILTVLDMGVAGLVISQLLARLLGMFASLIYLIKINHSLRFQIKNALRADFALIRKILFIGIPFAAEQLFFNGGKLLTQTFIVQLGTLAMTANAIANSMFMLFHIVSTALSVAVVTVVGQCIGRGDIGDARKFAKSFILLSTLSFLASAVIILPLFPYIVRLYAPPEAIIPVIFRLALITAIGSPIFWSHSFILPAALRAGGDSTYTSIVAMASMWLIRVTLGYVFGIPLGLGIVGIWLAMVIEWAFRAAIFVWRFKGDKWYRHKLVE
jgi:putative MATE family efflux protein